MTELFNDVFSTLRVNTCLFYSFIYLPPTERSLPIIGVHNAIKTYTIQENRKLKLKLKYELHAS
jgi:hypothetical protein